VIPEPVAWATMIAGFGLMGIAASIAGFPPPHRPTL